MLDLENIDNEKVVEILNKYFIENKIDKDNDIFIESPIRMYINADKERGALRFYAFIHSKNLIKNEDLESKIPGFVNYINKSSRTLKYATLTNETLSIMAEYGIILKGNVDDEFFIRTIKHIEKEVENTKSLLSILQEIEF